MSTYRMPRWGAGAVVAGGAAVAAAMLGVGVAHADDGTDQIHGWMVMPHGTGILVPATLSDPSNSLGLGTSVAGTWDSIPATPLSGIGSNDLFVTPFRLLGSPANLQIDDNWLPGVDESLVNVGGHNSTLAFLVPAVGGKELVDLLNIARGDPPPPLVNPDATGPIDIGGVPLASPPDGALLNDLANAVFTGDPASWGKATTLFDTLFGVNSAGATGAADPSTSASAFGAGAATPDAPVSTTPEGLLTTAVSNFTDANALLNAATGVEAAQPLSFNGNALQLLDQLLPAQDTISAHVGSLSGLVDQLFFVPLDQGWVDASHAALHGAQELAAATSGGLDIGLEVPSLQLIGDYLASWPVIVAADFF